MNILIDIIGSTVIGGLILLMVINLSLSNSQQKYSSSYELQLQQNAKTLAEIINFNLRKIGYKYSGNPFIETSKSRISFYSDIDSNGTADSVSIYLSDSTEVNYTANQTDKILIVKINNDAPRGPSLGITNLKFTYKNILGAQTFSSDSIKYVVAEIWVESPEKINDKYLFTYWEMAIHPRNL